MIVSRIVGFIIYCALAVLSVWSWAVAVKKWQEYQLLDRETRRFKDMVKRNSGSILDLFKGSLSFPRVPVVAVYEAACRELDYFIRHMEGEKRLPKVALDHIHNAVYRAITDELDKLNHSMAVLATAISCGPFLGLLGTVSGILLVFRRLGTLGNASLSVVAPGVYQALLTTVAGLLVAIPAVLFYNYYSSRYRKVSTDVENFAMELMAAIEKHYCI
ncbi:MAG: MotA/TolQ/ExbB proton channel family protein [bacterium]|nr:MotA/TolQ/ExbB proton channel family protein [bacterium]